MIWPFCPLDGMLESLEWRGNALRAFSTEQRIRLRNTPVRMHSHQYAWTAREYEKARAMFREVHPSAFQLPDWALAHRASVTAGASFIAFDNQYPTLQAGDSVAIIQNSDQYEELTISSSSSVGINLSFPVSETYSNAYVVQLLDADAAEALNASRTVQPIRNAQIEWMSYETTDLSALGSRPAHRSLPVVVDAACIGNSSTNETLGKPFGAVDNGIARPYRDTLQQQFVQQLGAVWQVKEREDQWALRRFLYWLRGGQKAFWLPDYNQGLTLLSNVAAGASTLTIQDVGFSGGYVTGDLFLLETDGTVHTFQVTDSELDTDGNEVLTLASPISASVAAADISQFCLMFCVTLSGNRVEWQHRSVVGPRVAAGVVEVPVP